MVSLETKWIEEISRVLVGKKITDVSYMTADECKELGWYDRAIIIELQDTKGNKTYLYPTSDDEGNNAGAIATSDPKLTVIPVMR
jgi:hypothetical protein